MNILFVHQSFPGQYRHILRALAKDNSHTIVGLGIGPPTEPIPSSISYVGYGLSRGNTVGLHDWMVDIDSKFIRAEACARACFSLRNDGFYPDLICAHSGWGEAIFLRDVWPNSRLLCYQEFFYHSTGFDFDFDPEFQGTPSWEECARLRLKNANPLLMLHAADWNVTPTTFQQSTFPLEFRSKISTIHDGIDTDLVSPASNAKPLSLPDGTTIYSSDDVITFVNRRIEPYRGCHTFIRAIPEIQNQYPESRIVIVGTCEGASYGQAPPGASWRDYFIEQIEGQYDPSRVHFTGSLPYDNFLNLLRLSSCHVYLTYPFVLSWSLLEAMSIGCPVIGSATPPVQEVISDSRNGLLVNFFSPHDLARSIDAILSNPGFAKTLGLNARNTIVSRYSLRNCVPRQLSLMQLVASGSL